MGDVTAHALEEVADAMGDAALDWPALLDGHGPAQWLAGLGAITQAEADGWLGGDLVARAVWWASRHLAALPPGWYVWRGVARPRAFYARRLRAVPPWVVWGSTLDQVAKQAAELERSRAR